MLQVAVTTELGVDLVEVRPDGRAAVLQRRSHLGCQQTADGRILIPNEIAGQIADALFRREEEPDAPLVLALLDDLSHPLEPNIQVGDAFGSEAASDISHQRGGNERLQHQIVRRAEAQLLAPLQEEMSERGAHIVTPQEVQPCFARNRSGRHSRAVRIGVGADGQIRTQRLRVVDRAGDHFTVFGIDQLAGGSWKAGVRFQLLHDRSYVEARALKNRQHVRFARAVDRAEDDARRTAGLDRQTADRRQVRLVDLRPEMGHPAITPGTHWHATDVADAAHELHELLIERRHHLAAVGPVELETVVGLGIVRCGDLHAGGRP